jgi:hypothetical protein
VGNLPALIASHQSFNGVAAVGLSPDSTKTYVFLNAPAYDLDASGNVLLAGNVHIMNTATLSVLSTLNCSPNPITAALLVKKRYFYVTQSDGTLCTVDTTTDLVVNSSAPGGFLAAEDIAGKRLFIADQQDNVVETVTLGKTGPTSDQQGVSFGGLPANSTVVGLSVFSK